MEIDTTKGWNIFILFLITMLDGYRILGCWSFSFRYWRLCFVVVSVTIRKCPSLLPPPSFCFQLCIQRFLNLSQILCWCVLEWVLFRLYWIVRRPFHSESKCSLVWGYYLELFLSVLPTPSSFFPSFLLEIHH